MNEQLELGESRKEQGIAEVAAHNSDWFNKATSCMERFVADRQAPFTMADFRRHVSSTLPDPNHPNAWGSVAYSFGKAGKIRKTGRYVKSDLPSAHARMVAEWIAV